MRRRRLVVFVLSAAMVIAGVTVPNASASATPLADAPTAGALPAPATCANPPDNPDATGVNRDRFIATWGQRIADKAWFDSFAKAETVPADVAADVYYSMDAATQAWLVACLVDNLVAASGQQATAAQVANYQIGLDLVIFGKKQLSEAKQQLNQVSQPPAPTVQAPAELLPQHLTDEQQRLAGQPSITSASLPKADTPAITTSSSKDYLGQASQRLQGLAGAGTPNPNISLAGNAAPTPKATPKALTPGDLIGTLAGILSTPIVPLLLKALNDLLQFIAKIQTILFTLPVINILATLFYRVCAESPTQPLACSIYLPIGVPVPADVNGDNFPDVLAQLLPIVTPAVGIDVSVQFGYARLTSGATPLPAHLFVVYDPPIIKKRIEFGWDGRGSTLANSAQAVFTLHNAYAALTGDIDVSAQLTANSPGSTEALTFAVKDLVGGSIGVPATEANPMAGAVQFTPFPTKVTANAHLTHGAAGDEDIFSLQTSTPSVVNALMTQDTTTTSPPSHRQFTALIDKLPTSVQVDLQHQGPKQIITYTAAAAIDHLQATDTAVGDTTHPGSYTSSIYDVLGVPSNIKLTLQGAQDILYQASSVIPQVSFSTQTFKDSVRQQEITAQAHQIPKNVHVTNTATNTQTNVTYDADSVLHDVSLEMYDVSTGGDTQDLLATALGIPTHIQFNQTKDTGVLDFQANAGIQKINASLTRNGGTILTLPGDHATVKKVGNQLGVDFQLSGFQAAHFDGSQKTIVSLNLNPGGQSFDALADLDSPNVLATVHVGALPSSMSVTIDPVGGTATYNASSVIPDLTGSFTQRDTQTEADFALLNLPKNITATWNTAGSAPQFTYSADSRLGKITGNYSKAPGDLAFHAVISDLPTFMKVSGADPISFDARTAADANPGSDHIGQILFQYASNGTFLSAPTPDDHLLLNTVGGATRAELVYTGLALISADTRNQQLHAEVENASPRLLHWFVTTDNLTLTGFIDKVPADIKVDQVGNDIQYHASSVINEIFTQLNRTNGDSITADVQGVPASIDLLFDAANSTLDWHSSTTVTSISAVAHLTAGTVGGSRAFDASLTIASIPTHWFATWPNGNVDFEAGGAGIGSIDARVSNHGSYHTLAGDHLNAFFDQSSGDLDASLHISNLTKAAFSKLTDSSGGGFVADLNMGSHGLFNFGADVTLSDSTKLNVLGSFDHLPSTIHLKSDGGRITYNGNDNPTLDVAVGAGDAAALAATPVPPTVHGVSARDGKVNGKIAVRAHVYLTGLPDSLDLNTPAGTYTVNNYHPTIDLLTVDVKLNALAPTPLTLLLTQGIGTDPVNFTFGPFQTTTAGDGTHNISLNYTASRDLGALNAEATYNNSDDAKLFISGIPGGTAPSISVNVGLGKDQKTVNINMSHDISQITASWKHTVDIDFAASVDLTNVPDALALVIGKDSASAGGKDVEVPDFQYHASHAGLNISAFATGSVATPVDATAAVNLAITNIGKDVSAAIDGGTHIHVTSSPATTSFLIVAAAEVKIDVDLGFSAGPFVNTGTLNVDANLHKLTLGFDNFSDVGLDLGITTGVTGQFSLFTFAEDSDTIIHLEDHFKVHVDLPDPFGGIDIHLVDVEAPGGGPLPIDLHNVIDHFRVTTNDSGDIFSIPVFEAILASCDVSVTARPKPGHSTSGPSLALPGPPPHGDGSPDAYLITPDPNLLGFTLPDWAVDVVAFFESPYGNHIGVDFGCHFGP